MKFNPKKDRMSRIWSIARCIGRGAVYYVILVGCYLIAILLLAAFVTTDGTSLRDILINAVDVINQNTTLVYVLLNTISLLLYFLLFIPRFKISSAQINIESIGMTKLLLMALFGLMASLVVNLIYVLISWNENFEVVEMATGEFILYSIGITVLAPVVEEILFRMVLLKGLRNYISTRQAVLISSLLFGLIHGGVFDVTYALVFGIFLGITTCKFERMIYPIVMHISFNVMAVCTQMIEFSSVAMCLVYTAIAVFLCIWSWYRIRKQTAIPVDGILTDLNN